MQLKDHREIPDGEILKSLVTRPGDMFDKAVRYANMIDESRLEWPLEFLNNFFLPIYRGQFILMQGRPGDAKTSFGIAIANMFGRHISTLRDYPYGNPLYVTAETTTQQIELVLTMERLNAIGKPNRVTGKAWNIEDIRTGAYNRADLAFGAMKLAELNVDLMGQDAELLATTLDIDVVYRAVQQLEKEDGKRPAFLILDYAQKLDAMSEKYVSSHNDHTAQIFVEVDQFCLATGIPVILMAQSNEYVDTWDVPIGAEGSVHGASGGHKVASDHFALMRPWKKRQYQKDKTTGMAVSTVNTGWGEYPNKANTQIVRELKSRMKDPTGVGKREIAFEFNPGTMEIKEFPKTVKQTIDMNDVSNYSDDELMEMSQAGFEFR